VQKHVALAHRPIVCPRCVEALRFCRSGSSVTQTNAYLPAASITRSHFRGHVRDVSGPEGTSRREISNT
jgi:hypothetical protein